MGINWKVRLTNKYFWISAIPMLFLLIQGVADVFGFTLDLSELQEKLLVVINLLSAFLVTLGIINDPTTEGLSDSEQAMTYTEPK